MKLNGHAQARATFERLVPEKEERRRLAGIYAELILYAHAAGPKSWEVTVDNKQDLIRLNVGPVWVADVQRNRVGCCLRNKGVVAAVSGVTRVRPSYYLSSLGGEQLRFDGALSDFLKRYKFLKAGIFAWIHDAAEERSATSWGYAHSQSFVDYISRLSGHRLPSPGLSFGIGIRNFIQYHNCDNMGASPTELSQGQDFGISTNKSPERVVGNRIWLIAGEGKPRRYYLTYSYVADNFEKAPVGSDFRYSLDGQAGKKYFPPIPLNDFPWFQKFLKTRFYSHGLTPVSKNISDQLERLGESQSSLPGEEELDSISTLEELAERMNGLSTVRRKAFMERWIRNDAPLVRKLKKMAGGRCQFPGCKARILKKDGTPYLEVAHIEAVADGGTTVFGNLLVLCPNHHKAFDLGRREITEQTPTLVKGRLNGKKFEISLINLKRNKRSMNGDI